MAESWWGKRLNKSNDGASPELSTPFTIKDNQVKIKPFDSFSKNLNGEKKFAITANTENGKYVRSNMLFFKLNGVEIYAPLNSILMINTEDNSVFIREADNVSKSISSNNAETMHYIILYTDIGYDSEDVELAFRWESVIGMKKAYHSIQNNASRIDVDKSIVLSESVAVQDALSVREFCEHIKNAEIFNDEEEFDINNYAGSDYI